MSGDCDDVDGVVEARDGLLKKHVAIQAKHVDNDDDSDIFVETLGRALDETKKSLKSKPSS